MITIIVVLYVMHDFMLLLKDFHLFFYVQITFQRVFYIPINLIRHYLLFQIKIFSFCLQINLYATREHGRTL